MGEEVSKTEPGRKRSTSGGFSFLGCCVFIRNNFINEPPAQEEEESIINYDPVPVECLALGESREKGVPFQRL